MRGRQAKALARKVTTAVGRKDFSLLTNAYGGRLARGDRLVSFDLLLLVVSVSW